MGGCELFECVPVQSLMWTKSDSEWWEVQHLLYAPPPPVKLALCLHDYEFTQYKGPVFSLSQTDLNKAFSQSLVACDEQTGGVVGGGGGGVVLHVGKCRHI